MEPLWSPAVATGSNRWQWRGRENGSNRRKPLPWVATSCRDPKMEGCTPQEREGVASLAPQKRQVLRTRRPTGLDAATLTVVPCLVNLAPPAAHHSASTPTVVLASRAMPDSAEGLCPKAAPSRLIKSWARIRGAAGLQKSNGDELRRGFQSVSTHPINRTRGEHHDRYLYLRRLFQPRRLRLPQRQLGRLLG